MPVVNKKHFIVCLVGMVHNKYFRWHSFKFLVYLYVFKEVGHYCLEKLQKNYDDEFKVVIKVIRNKELEMLLNSFGIGLSS